jgi:hypothetical protein
MTISSFICAEPAISCPWSCGFEDDCEHGWHLADYYHVTSESWRVSRYSDGTCELIDTEDVPDFDACNKAWQEYFAYVVDTGKDPLSQFYLPPAAYGVVRSRLWQAQIRAHIGMSKSGPLVNGLRRNGRGPWLRPDDVPRAVRDYLELLPEHKNRLYNFRGTKEHSFATLEASSIVRSRRPDSLTLLIWFRVDERGPAWTPEKIRAYLKKVARRNFRRNRR